MKYFDWVLSLSCGTYIETIYFIYTFKIPNLLIIDKLIIIKCISYYKKVIYSYRKYIWFDWLIIFDNL